MKEIKNPEQKTYWIAHREGVEHHGETDPECVTNFPAGLSVEPFTDEDDFYTRLRNFVVKWQPGIAVEVGQILHYEVDDKLYEVIQAHTTQSDWTPDIVPALFNIIHEPLPGEDYPPWVQPTGAHDAYPKGARVTHVGKNWESTIDANTTEPGTLLPWGYWIEI